MMIIVAALYGSSADPQRIRRSTAIENRDELSLSLWRLKPLAVQNGSGGRSAGSTNLEADSVAVI